VSNEQKIAENQTELIETPSSNIDPSEAEVKIDLPSNKPDLGPDFEVCDMLGQGGMGTVYKVFDKRSNSFFAAKFLRKELAEDNHAVKRFEQEIRTASALSHGNLVSVFSHGRTASGVPYFLMEYTEGASLAATLKNDGSLSCARALEIFIQTCEALEYAHRHNVIHRDLKPSNIILKKTESGADVVRVLDFGIAKILASESSDFSRTNLTQTGDIFGSPLYMSPEQCQNNPQDARSDVYALGCVMYESLTGVQPFADGNAVKIILKHMNYKPPAITTKSKNDPRLEAFDEIIQKCLEKSPDDRYQTIEELKRDLRAVEAGLALPSRMNENRFRLKNPSPTKMTPSMVFMLTIMTLIANVTMFYFFGNHPSETKSPVESGDAFTDATTLDAKSYSYFVRGDYEKAAPLLEFGIATYKERVEADKKSNAEQQLIKDKTLLTENIQHVGKCYMEIAKRANLGGDREKAKTYFNKALDRYREAMQFWMTYKYSNLQQTMAPEAVTEYEFVLKQLGLNDELSKLKSWQLKN
jgi:serine/threonine protein kinase